MATAKAEIFDIEQFGKLVALFDSNNPGEVENAFRKAMLMCAKHGLRFTDAAASAFGQDNGARISELEEELRRRETEWSPKLAFASEEIERLKQELAEARAANEIPDGGHVIDLPGRLRRAWQFAGFRLFILTLALGPELLAGEQRSGVAGPLGIMCAFLFGCWSVAQFRWLGLAQMLLKWLVFGAVLIAGGVALDNCGAANRGPVIVLVLTAALLLTLSTLSLWLGRRIRKHIWESAPMRTMRRWFDYDRQRKD